MVLTIFGAVFGVIAAQRFRVFIIFPVGLLLFTLVLIEKEIAADQNFYAILPETIIGLFGLQVGYIFGLLAKRFGRESNKVPLNV